MDEDILQILKKEGNLMKINMYCMPPFVQKECSNNPLWQMNAYQGRGLSDKKEEVNWGDGTIEGQEKEDNGCGANN